MAGSSGSRSQRLAAWRAARREELTLPSGLEVTVQRVSILDIAAQGKLPKPLLGEIEQLAKATVEDNGNMVINLDVLDKLPEFNTLIDAVVCAAVVDPPIADVPDATHLGVHELPFEDRLAIFERVNEGAKQIAPFSGEPAGDGPARRDGAAVPPEAEQLVS